jgi:WD40 repeat protein/transcriptional regulator with XRE-family HTH domain
MRSSYHYRERDYAFGNLCLTLRTRMGVTQSELAKLLGVTERTLQTWEGGESYPKVESLKRLIAVCAQHRVFERSHEEKEIRALWQAAHQRVLLDEGWLRALMAPATGAQEVAREVTAENATAQVLTELRMPASSPASQPRTRIDWVGSLDVSGFQGREVELAQLSQWMMQEHCRLIAIVGMGGIGKSALISRLGKLLAGHFDAVLWRSVRDAPSCEELVADCIAFCSDTPPAEFPPSLEQRINQLVARLQVQRCLLVIDNLETLLQEGDPAGNYRAGYEGYGRLIQRLGESAHQSCVVLTSREKPREIGPLEGSRSPVRSLGLLGLSEEAARALLQEKDLRGESSAWRELIATYAGNPLALMIVGQAIVDLFAGEIVPFLQSGELIFNGIRAVLRQQVTRLTPLEQTLLTWLAVVREWTSLDTLLSLLIPRATRARVLEALEGLSRRSLIERGQQGSFTLQSVVMEYVAAALLEQLTEEIISGEVDLLRRFALEQAQSKDYVRQTQVRLLVRPLVEQLRAELDSDTRCEEHLLHLVAHFRTEEAFIQGYGPANAISLLKELRGDLRGMDLSRLSIQGAYLQGVQMQDATLAGAHLRDVVFTSTFDVMNRVAVSPDGRYWAVGSSSGEVRVWREEGRTPHLALRAHADRVLAVAFSPDGRLLATASIDSTVKLWEVASGAVLWTLRGHDGPVPSMNFHPDGHLLVSGGYDGVVRLWEVRTGTCLRVLEAQREPIAAVAWSPDGRLIASGGSERTIRLWEMQSGNSVHSLSGHSSEVLGLAFASDGTVLASAGADGTVKLWEVETATCRSTLQGHTGSVTAVAWSPDGRWLASAGSDTTIRLWSQSRGGAQQIFQGHTAAVLSLAFMPDGKTLLSGGFDWTLRVWEIESGQLLRTLLGYAAFCSSVAWSPDGKKLLSAESDGTVIQWRVADRTPVQVFKGHAQPVSSVRWSPDGCLFASGSFDQTVRIWEATTGRCQRILQGYTEMIGIVAWSPDGLLLASGSYDHAVRVWDLRTDRNLWVGHAHTGADWHPDGTRLASGGSDGSVLVWKATDGSLLQRLQGHRGPVNMVAWSPDGTRLASCAQGDKGGQLFIWETDRGTHSCIVDDYNSIIFTLAWSPDGRLLVGGCTDGTVHWWDAKQGVLLGKVQAHMAIVWSVQVSPDGRTLASGGEDGAIQLWDMATRERLASLRSDQPYERLDITGTTGLSEVKRVTLRVLGAVEAAVPVT